MRSRNLSWQLFLLSAVSLFLELAIIRWLSSEVRIFAYFKNLPLMAAFLGFGIGFSLPERQDLFVRWFPRLICCLSILIAGAAGLGITHVIFVDPRQYFLLGSGFGDHDPRFVESFLKTAKAILVIVGLFFLVMMTFATLATKLGQLLNQEKPLRGYSINVLGSLMGILAFSAVSLFQWPPPVWLSLVFVGLLSFYREQRKFAVVYFVVSIAVAVCADRANPAIWSPYYRIALSASASPEEASSITFLTVNYDGFQAIQDLSSSHIEKLPEKVQQLHNRHYNLPYHLSRRQIESVLILGGGSGNDAAAALRNGATRVDVVEIDPAIARIGSEVHPERPYSSERVRLFVDDARSFLQRTKAKYDLVVFATLDSHTAFSSLSSLRLDNFVFTEESVRSAKEKLNTGGGIAINFFTIKEWLSQRHLSTLQTVMGPSVIVFGSPQLEEAILLAGDRFDASRDPGKTVYRPMEASFQAQPVDPITDDWPFLFLEKRGIPFHYLMPLFIILMLSLIPVRLCGVSSRQVNWHLFFMGAAFLLIETKAVTTLALIFGSTWLVNSIVIGAILCMILAANFLMEVFSGSKFSWLYAALFVSLLLNFCFRFSALNNYSWGVRLGISSLVVALPILFAALIFAKAFAAVRSPSASLASNLLGGLVGGLLEYLDMWVGLQWLNILALALYAFSAVFLVVGERLRIRALGSEGSTSIVT
jgi:Spermine/spermidine synthase domain